MDDDVTKWPRVRFSGVTVPDNVSEDTIRTWVMSLLGGGRESHAFERILLVGQKAKRPLIEALSHPEFLQRHESPDLEPFDELCSLLEVIVPSDAVPRLLEIARDSNKRHARAAIHVLGCIADESSSPALIAALHDDDDYTRAMTLIGLHHAISKKRGSRSFWSGLYPSLIPLIDRQDNADCGLAPLLIATIEPEVGTSLLRAVYCTRSNHRLGDTLAALRKSGAAMPKSDLDRLVAELSHDETEVPWCFALGELLPLLASNDYPQARQLSLGYLDHAVDAVRRGAADALYHIDGMEDPLVAVSRLVETKGYGSLTEPQRTVWCVMGLVNQEHEGGLSEYLAYSSGIEANDLKVGLTLIGAPQLAEILGLTFLKVFGASGPADSLEQYNEHVKRFGDGQMASLTAFDHEYARSPERIEVLVVKYALQHPEAFRPILIDHP